MTSTGGSHAWRWVTCGIDKGHHPYVGLKVLGEWRGASSRCVPALLVIIRIQELVDEEAPQVCLKVKVEPDSDSEAE